MAAVKNTPSQIDNYDERTSPRERAAVTTIICPKCDAKTGKLCWKSGEKKDVRVRPHPERTRLAKTPARKASDAAARKTSTKQPASKQPATKTAKTPAKTSASKTAKTSGKRTSAKTSKSNGNGSGKEAAASRAATIARQEIRNEERAAAAQQRALDKATRTGKAKAAREQSARRKAIIVEELTRQRTPRCTCGITEHSTVQDLRNLGAGCTSGANGEPGFVCPTLDAIRRRIATRGSATVAAV